MTEVDVWIAMVQAARGEDEVWATRLEKQKRDPLTPVREVQRAEDQLAVLRWAWAWFNRICQAMEDGSRGSQEGVGASA